MKNIKRIFIVLLIVSVIFNNIIIFAIENKKIKINDYSYIEKNEKINTINNWRIRTEGYIPENLKQVNDVSMNAVIGPDDRVQVMDTTTYPGSTYVYIEVKFPNGKWTRGTGCMVSKNMVLTARHCIYDKKLRRNCNGNQSICWYERKCSNIRNV